MVTLWTKQQSWADLPELGAWHPSWADNAVVGGHVSWRCVRVDHG